MPRREKGKKKKKKSSVGGGTTKGTTADRTGMLHKEKCIGERDKVL